MITTNYLKSGRKHIVLLITTITVLFSACSSSNQIASSFGKRKYTKGHITSPIVKLKTEYKSYTITAPVIPLQKVSVENTTLTKTATADVKANFSAPSKSSIVFNQPGKSPLNAITKNAETNTKDNVSLLENSTNAINIASGVGYQDHNGNAHRHHYLLDFFLCLLLFIVFGLLALSALSGFFGVLSWLFGIAAVVFFILWIVSLTT